MNGEPFKTRLLAAQQRSQSTLAIGIAPAMDKLPALIAKYDDPFLPLGKLIIDATHTLVCAYVFHLSAYLSIGAAGAVALERTLAYVPAGIIKILHGPFASAHYARAAFEDAFGADAVTLAPTSIAAEITPYVQQAQHAAFVKTAPGLDDQFIRQFICDLNTDYPGQIGTYRTAGPDHNVLDLLDAPYPELHWHWGEHLYRARTVDFADVLRQTAAELRQPPPTSDRRA